MATSTTLPFVLAKPKELNEGLSGNLVLGGERLPIDFNFPVGEPVGVAVVDRMVDIVELLGAKAVCVGDERTASSPMCAESDRENLAGLLTTTGWKGDEWDLLSGGSATSRQLSLVTFNSNRLVGIGDTAINCRTRPSLCANDFSDI